MSSGKLNRVTVTASSSSVYRLQQGDPASRTISRRLDEGPPLSGRLSSSGAYSPVTQPVQSSAVLSSVSVHRVPSGLVTVTHLSPAHNQRHSPALTRN